MVNITDMAQSSVAKGETLEDFVRVMERYSDLVVLRHPEKVTPPPTPSITRLSEPWSRNPRPETRSP